MSKTQKISKLYDKYYKFLLLIPIAVVVFSLFSVINLYQKTGDVMYKDVSLSGGTTITIDGEIDVSILEEKLLASVPDASFRKLTDFATGRNIATIIETIEDSEVVKSKISELGINLTDENSSIEFSGSSLGRNFYKQLVIALIISFILMSIVIFFLFKSVVPSIAIIFSAFSDILIPLSAVGIMGVRISSAGIAAFLMLVGYSVDTNILLTTRTLKKKEGSINKRMFGAFRAGSLMTIASLSAVLPVFFLVTGLPDSFRQIFLILSLGLLSDLMMTWIANASIIKWYCEKKGIK